jgi:hypothetical protein
MVLTVSFALSPVIGLCCHRRRRSLLRQLERQRRGVRTTRLRRPQGAPSSEAPPASTASRPASVTIAKRPSVGRDGAKYGSDLGRRRRELFFEEGLDRWNRVDPAQQIRYCAHLIRRVSRRRNPAVLPSLNDRLRFANPLHAPLAGTKSEDISLWPTGQSFP